MKLVAVAVSVGVCVLMQTVRAQTEVPHVTNQVKAATDYFKWRLGACLEQEVQCLWFINNNPVSGRIMNFDLLRHQSQTFMDYYNWAVEGGQDRRLEPSKIELVKRLVKGLPASDPNVDFAGGVHIAFWQNGKVMERVYSLDHLPKEVRKIYEIGGGKLPDQMDQ